MRSDCFMTFIRSAMSRVRNLEHSYPRSKCVDQALFLFQFSSQECHAPFELTDCEYDQAGCPFPKIDYCAHTFFDTDGGANLEDLNGMINRLEEKDDE